ncbi:MAG TPA: hypothetical protein VL485_33205 [Ktedonobacteraceae bacterium]|nr:hypothetical protein [Ktedonobacteraceae bacterium]
MDTQRLKTAPEKSLSGTSRLGVYLQSLLARYHFTVYGLIAFVIILLAATLRVLILQKGWPTLDSDEATTGLMALHILNHGEHPFVFYGQDYMGTIEAYLATIAFAFLGPSVFALRLGMVLLFVLFLVSTYLLTSLLYSRKAALLVLCVLSLGTPELFFRELEANGGYGEIILFGSLLLLLASWLALSSHQGPHFLHVSWRRTLVYVTWSLVAGLAIWSDPLILPFVGTTALLLLIFCRSELRRSVVALVACGFLLGISPQLLYGATMVHPVPISLFGDSVSAQTQLMPSTPGKTAIMSASQAEPARQVTLLGQLVGSVMVSVPVMTGGSALCAIQAKKADLSLDDMDTSTLQCTLVHGIWGVGYLALLLMALVAAFRAYWQRWRQMAEAFATRISIKLWFRAPAPARPLVAHRDTVRHAARFTVLISACLTWFLYTLFPQAELSPWASSRYLVGLLITYPAVLAFLWEMTALDSLLTWRHLLRAGASAVLLMLVAVIFLIGTLNLFNQFSAAQAQNAQQFALLNDLRQVRARSIYTDYWTCNRLAFQSLEGIRCSVLQEQLDPGLNRYEPYAQQVARDPLALYVFPLNSAQDDNFAELNIQRNMHYMRQVRDGYAIYMPQGYTIAV